MKKLFLALVVLMGSSQFSFAQEEQKAQAPQQAEQAQSARYVPEVIKLFKDEPGAEYHFQAPTKEQYEKVLQAQPLDSAQRKQALEGTKMVQGVHLLMLQKCSEEVQARFDSVLTNLDAYGYVHFADVKNQSTKARLWAKFSVNIFQEMALVIHGVPNTQKPLLTVVPCEMTKEQAQKFMNGTLPGSAQ